MSILDDENILIKRAKLSIKDNVKALLRLNYLDELVEYLDNVMYVKDYQWKSITHPYTGDNMVVLADGVISVCQLKLNFVIEGTSSIEEPILFLNPLSKYRGDKIRILNKLDIEQDSIDDFGFVVL